MLKCFYMVTLSSMENLTVECNLVGYNDIHKSMDEFEFRSDPITETPKGGLCALNP